MARVSTPNSITAAIKAVSPSEVQQLVSWATGRSYWDYYKAIPDIRYIVNLSGRLLALSTPRVEKMDGTGTWNLDLNPPAEITGALVTVYDSPGGLEDISRRFCQQYVLDGQCYLVGYDAENGLVIESLSKQELKAEGEFYFRQRSLNMGVETLPAGTKVSRVWRRHPELSDMAETPMQALTGDMDTLIALNKALRARVRSRLAAAGILFLPNGIIATGPTDAPDGTGKAVDPVTRKLLEAMAAAIRDEDSADAAMPVVLRGPDDLGEKIKHITLDRMIDETEMDLRKELRENIATGLDAPSAVARTPDESVNTNHWNAASVKMEMWEHTVAPIGDVLWEGLTRMVLTPWLEKKGVQGNYRWRVDRDSVQIRDNQDEKTRVALDRNLIGPVAGRRRLGIPDSDKPSNDEYIRAVGIELQIPELAFYKIPVEGIDLAVLRSSKTGPGASGNGRDIPAPVPGDAPKEGDPRVR